jgi:hypothetical protein
LKLDYSKIFFFVIAFLCSHSLSAQFRGKGDDENGSGNGTFGRPATTINQDSTKGDVTRPNKNKLINLKIYTLNFKNSKQSLDTSIHNLHTKMGLAFWQQSLGNVNTAVYNLKYSAPIFATQTLGNLVYQPYNTNVDSVLFFNTTNPYTVMTYNAGSKQEQGVKILHTQNINAVNNFSFSYAKYGGPGYFDLQRSTRDNALATFMYRPNAKSRFSGKYAVVYNQNKQDENGGIQAESDLKRVAYKLRNTIPVNYTGSGFTITTSAVKNRYRQAQIKLKNYYALSFANTPQDTVGKTANAQLFYTFQANLEKQDYRDKLPTTDRYRTLYTGTFKSKDSIKATHTLNTTQNEFGIVLPNIKKINASLEGVFAIETQQYKTDSSNKVFVNNYVGASLNNVDSNAKWSYNADLKLYLLGKAVGNYYLKAEANRTIKDLRIGAHFIQNLLDAPYLMQNYVSNFYRWDNSFKKQFNTTIGGSMHIPKWKLNIEANNVNMLNYLYYTDSLKVQQAANPIVILQLQAHKQFLYKKWTADVDAIVQQTQASNPINIPNLITNLNIGYTSYIFKRSMLANIGVQATYNSNYFTPSYLPQLNAYGNSNNYQQQNLPNVGVYFNGSVKRFRYSLQVIELQQPFNLKNFSTEVGLNRMLVEAYPAPDWQIKVGFAWVFLN